MRRLKKKRKVYSSFRDNIWGVDLADMQSLSIYIKKNKYLLCAICLVVNMRGSSIGTSIVNAFQKLIANRRKPYKIWVD